MNRTRQASAREWFVQAAGQVWGPYPEARIAVFVEEGRVAPDTLVGASEQGPFIPAAHQARLHGLFGDVVVPPPEDESLPAAPVSTEVVPARPLLVWATLKSRRLDRFEAMIGGYGPFVRIGEGLWLIRARMSAPSLRNVLTRRLEAEDAVMVLTAPIEGAAWFNIDGETDRTLRQLWAE